MRKTPLGHITEENGAPFSPEFLLLQLGLPTLPVVSQAEIDPLFLSPDLKFLITLEIFLKAIQPSAFLFCGRCHDLGVHTLSLVLESLLNAAA